MAVQDQTPYQEYIADGTTTLFPIGFDFNTNTHVIVSVNDVVSEYQKDWGFDGGQVKFNIPPTKDSIVKIWRDTPLKREITYKTYDNSLRPEVFNKDFDRIWWKLQELGVADLLLKLYVDKQDNKLQKNINDLRKHSDDQDLKLKRELMEILDEHEIHLEDIDKSIDQIFKKISLLGTSSILGGKLYGSIEEGIRKTKNGNYFNVVGADDDTFAELYKNENGTAVSQDKKYPSVNAVNSARDGVNSISELLAIKNPKNGMRIFVKGLQGGYFEYNLKKTTINDGIIIFNGWVRITLETGIRPEWAGAPRDGSSDDAFAIRLCVNYFKSRNIGGRINFSVANGQDLYVIDSVDTVNNSGIVVNQADVYFDIESEAVILKAMRPMKSVIYLDQEANFSMKKGNVYGEKKAEHGILSSMYGYTSQIELEGVRVLNAWNDQINIRTFLTKMENVVANGGYRGIVILPVPPSIVTSCVLNGCYTLNNGTVGYYIDIACYTLLIGCACDHAPLAYDLHLRGGSMIACGAENIDKILRVRGFRGVVITGLYAQRAGSIDPNNPSDSLIEFQDGFGATISGVDIEVSEGRYYKHKLALTGKNYGSEAVTVLDNSVRREETNFIVNFNFATRPIKFLRGDETSKPTTYVIESAIEFRDRVNLLAYYQVNHDVVIQLQDGLYDLSTLPTLIKNISGGKKLLIKGNPNNRSAVTIYSNSQLQISDCTAKVQLQDLTVSGALDSEEAVRIIVDNSYVILHNILLRRNGFISKNAVQAINNAVVQLQAGTGADSAGYLSDIFASDISSEYKFSPTTIAPTGVNWTNGMQIKHAKPTTFIGWVFSNGSWKTYGAIT